MSSTSALSTLSAVSSTTASYRLESVLDFISVISLSRAALALRRLFFLIFGYLSIPQLSAPPPVLLLDGSPAGWYPGDTANKMLFGTLGLAFTVLVGILSVWFFATRTPSRSSSASNELSAILESTYKSITQVDDIILSPLVWDSHDGPTSPALCRASSMAFIKPDYLNPNTPTETTLPGLLPPEGLEAFTREPLAASDCKQSCNAYHAPTNGLQFPDPMSTDLIPSPRLSSSTDTAPTPSPDATTHTIRSRLRSPGLLQRNGPTTCIMNPALRRASSTAFTATEYLNQNAPTETTLPGLLPSEGLEVCKREPRALSNCNQSCNIYQVPTGCLESRDTMSTGLAPSPNLCLSTDIAFTPSPDAPPHTIRSRLRSPGLLQCNGHINCILPPSASMYFTKHSGAKTTFPGLRPTDRKGCMLSISAPSEQRRFQATSQASDTRLRHSNLIPRLDRLRPSRPRITQDAPGAMQDYPTGLGKTYLAATTLSSASPDKIRSPFGIDLLAHRKRRLELDTNLDARVMQLLDEKQERRRKRTPREGDAGKAPLAGQPLDDALPVDRHAIAGRHVERWRDGYSGDILSTGTTLRATTTTTQTEKKNRKRIRKRRKNAAPTAREEEVDHLDATASLEERLRIDFDAINRRRTARCDMRNVLAMERQGMIPSTAEELQALEEKTRRLEEQEQYLPALPEPPTPDISCDYD
ncbi:hypothetical protein OE88DRAFT_1730996 [Heliocybe sulcata]|uniref:Uncharacterized protein n=1 Tax=Heliocybe sulcata TaxID=5364 RepID=A0A5C3NJV0_9AGAM|nr:hypothetical protein OE88DRAFT_1730996 [Heliocybe sulcata]